MFLIPESMARSHTGCRPKPQTWINDIYIYSQRLDICQKSPVDRAACTLELPLRTVWPPWWQHAVCQQTTPAYINTCIQGAQIEHGPTLSPIYFLNIFFSKIYIIWYTYILQHVYQLRHVFIRQAESSSRVSSSSLHNREVLIDTDID